MLLRQIILQRGQYPCITGSLGQLLCEIPQLRSGHSAYMREGCIHQGGSAPEEYALPVEPRAPANLLRPHVRAPIDCESSKCAGSILKLHRFDRQRPVISRVTGGFISAESILA